MRNGRWLVVGFAVAILALSACGSEGGGSDGAGVNGDDGGSGTGSHADGSSGGHPGGGVCGDHVCNAGETCGSCVLDCGCDISHGCRNDACVPAEQINPLIASMWGSWRRQVDDRQVDVYVDPNDTTCNANGQPQGDPGDACVHGFDPIGGFILKGTMLHWTQWSDSTVHAEGQVLNDGTRVEFDYDNGIVTHIIYVKQ